MTMNDWVDQKYPTAPAAIRKALCGIETANPNLPHYVTLPERPESRHERVRRMRRIAVERAAQGLDR